MKADTQNGSAYPAAPIIERFLVANPGTPLLVATGTMSAKGLAWLAERTVGRPVRLLVGSVGRSVTGRASEEDRDAAVRFLQRPDVQVLSWYSTGKGSRAAGQVHMKLYATPNRVLAGSANLTGQGLWWNEEVMVVAEVSEQERLFAHISSIADHPNTRDQTEQVLRILNPRLAAEQAADEEPSQTPHIPPPPSPIRQPAGCLIPAALTGVAVVVVAGSTQAFLRRIRGRAGKPVAF